MTDDELAVSLTDELEQMRDTGNMLSNRYTIQFVCSEENTVTLIISRDNDIEAFTITIEEGAEFIS